MAETLLVHDSLCSISQVDPFGRPPLFICLKLVSSLQEEQILGETLMIRHRTRRNPRGPGLHSHSEDLPFQPWLPLVSYSSEWDGDLLWSLMILRSPGETRHYPLIWLSTVLGAPFVLRRLVVLALIATSVRSTEWGGDLHGPRMILLEKIGMIFVPYSRRGPLTYFSLSVFWKEWYQVGWLLWSKFSWRKGSGKSRQRGVWYLDDPGVQQTCENTQLATRKRVIWMYHLRSGDLLAVI